MGRRLFAIGVEKKASI